jgi:hypothetical protein
MTVTPRTRIVEFQLPFTPGISPLTIYGKNKRKKRKKRNKKRR